MFTKGTYSAGGEHMTDIIGSLERESKDAAELGALIARLDKEQKREAINLIRGVILANEIERNKSKKGA
jgi:hypothetical protein